MLHESVTEKLCKSVHNNYHSYDKTSISVLFLTHCVDIMVLKIRDIQAIASCSSLFSCSKTHVSLK